MNMTLKQAPIALFVYNRVDCLRGTLESLSENHGIENTEVFIFSDGSKPGVEEDAAKVNAVREFIRNNRWKFTYRLIESEKNKGLAASVIAGVTRMIDEFGSVIVLEDDLEISKGFLNYMNAALAKYSNEESVMQVSGCLAPIRSAVPDDSSCFLPVSTSLGWATWKRAWKKFDEHAAGYEELKTDTQLRRNFDLDGLRPFSNMLIRQMENKDIDSWAIRWWWTVFRSGGLVLYPGKSMVMHTGYGEGATHATKTGVFAAQIDPDHSITGFPEKVHVNEEQWNSMKKFYSEKDKTPKPAGKNFFKRLFNR
jgi:hypothetical protein